MDDSLPEDDDDPLRIVGTTVADKYAIESVAGEGGFSIVYRAQHLIWKQPVAIKFFRVLEDASPTMREKLLEDFVQEGKLMSELSSKSAAIVQARDIGRLARPDGGWLPYMVLEWLEGEPLDLLLAREQDEGLPARDLIATMGLLDAVVVALDVAHRRGVAHRDLKPANIMIDGDPRSPEASAKLLDFGIAKVMSDHEQLAQQLQKTGKEITAFTPHHGAPEQFSRNYGATGPWTDVYALALILIEILRGGARALEGDTFFELGVSSCNPDRRPTPRTLGLAVTAEVEGVFARALAVEPSLRFADAGAFWRALHRGVFPHGDTWRGGGRHTTGDPPSVDSPEEAVAASKPTVPFPDAVASTANPGAAALSATGDPATATTTSPVDRATTRPRERGSQWAVAAALFTAGGVGAFAIFGGSGATEASAPSRPSATASVSAVASGSAAAPSGPESITWAGPCPERMKPVIGGAFEMGSNDPSFALWKPAHEVKLDTFCLDVHEVTVAQYDTCVREGGCRPAAAKPDFPRGKTTSPEDHARELNAYAELCNADKPGRENHPVNCVDWYRADTYCRYYGLRLPTEAEWELAARGTDGRVFPWGNDAGDHTYMNAGGPEWRDWRTEHGMTAPARLMYEAADGYAGTSPVGKFPRAQTQSGQLDMVGNVWEWTADWYALYDAEPETNPKGPAVGDRKAIRGGGFNGVYENWLNPAARYHQLATASVHAIGFRCAADVREAN
ncbi:MAG: bifunctional serine/threonine-protein kinase/formylglycine-generating enzyme family protein [Myxococcota bacterium]